MTEKEKGILDDAILFLDTFSDVPGKGQADQVDNYWAMAAGALEKVGNKWRHHPLVEKVFVGIYEYLEIKQKEMSK